MADRSEAGAGRPVETPTTIVIIDGHRVFVDALSLLLEAEPDIEVVGTSMLGISGYELCASLRPDVALVDVALPDVDGVTVTREIIDRSPDTHVVVIAALADDDVVVSAIEAGAVGFVRKVSAVDALLTVVRQARTGNIVLPEDRHDEILRRWADRVNVASPEVELTSRERALLSAFARGVTTGEAAREVGGTEQEINEDIRALVSKLGARSLMEAVLVAIRRGIVSLDGGA